MCGRIGTQMPPWALDQGGSLNDQQIENLVLLITEPPEGLWESMPEFVEQQHLEPELPPIEEITSGATVTGATSYVCGQRAPAQPEETGPVEVRTNWEQNMTDNRFSATRMGVPANQPVTVVVRNNGQALHNWHVQNVRATNGQEVTTPLMPGGQSQTVTFTISQPGTYNFICDVHPVEMRGTLVVQEGGASASPSPSPAAAGASPSPPSSATGSPSPAPSPSP
jgi:plastocyanin